MFLQSLIKFHQWLFKILRKQNVTDTLSFVRSDNVKTVYPPTQTQLGGGGGIITTLVSVAFLMVLSIYGHGDHVT